MDLDKGKESVLESLLRVNDIESAIKSLNYILEINPHLHCILLH
jgi:hypothetical protein